MRRLLARIRFLTVRRLAEHRPALPDPAFRAALRNRLTDAARSPR